jgi:hypothetical protein
VRLPTWEEAIQKLTRVPLAAPPPHAYPVQPSDDLMDTVDSMRDKPLAGAGQPEGQEAPAHAVDGVAPPGHDGIFSSTSGDQLEEQAAADPATEPTGALSRVNHHSHGRADAEIVWQDGAEANAGERGLSNGWLRVAWWSCSSN